MKWISKIYRVVAATAAITALVACRDYTPTTSSTLATPNADIATIRAMCVTLPITFENDVVIAGRVTTSDREGNFRRTLCIDDGTGGAEIMVGQYDLHCKYPLGAMLSIKMRGTTAFVTDGILQIGLKAESYSYREVDYFYAEAVADKYIGRGVDINESLEPIHCQPSELNDALCGRLVSIADVRHSPIDERDTDTALGTHRFTDANGNEVYLYVGDYAEFAAEHLPEEPIRIVGTLHYGGVGYGIGNRYYIKPSSRDDFLPNSNID